MLTLSSTKFHRKNKTIIFNTLKFNNYPPNLIKKLLASITHKTNITIDNINEHKPNNTQEKTYRSMTYVKNISEKIEKIINTHTTNTRLAHKNNNCLHNVFSKLKDKVPLQKKTNTIYMIPCLGSDEHGPCDETYVGQTKQYLEKRLQNHRRDLRCVNESTTGRTALVDHFHNLNHYPDFGSVSVLGTQRNLTKRLTIEALHIYTQNTYNKKRNTDKHCVCFLQFIRSIHKHKHTNK